MVGRRPDPGKAVAPLLAVYAAFFCGWGISRRIYKGFTGRWRVIAWRLENGRPGQAWDAVGRAGVRGIEIRGSSHLSCTTQPRFRLARRPDRCPFEVRAEGKHRLATADAGD